MFDLLKLVLPILLESASWELYFNQFYYVSSNLMGYAYGGNGNFFNNFNEVTKYDVTFEEGQFDYFLDVDFNGNITSFTGTEHNEFINTAQIAMMLATEGSLNPNITEADFIRLPSGTSAFILKKVFSRLNYEFILAYLYSGQLSSEYGFYEFTITKGLNLRANVTGNFYYYTSNLELRPGKDVILTGDDLEIQVNILAVNNVHITLDQNIPIGPYAIFRFDNYVPKHTYPLRSLLNVIQITGDELTARGLAQRVTPVRCDLSLLRVDLILISPPFMLDDEDTITFDLTPALHVVEFQETGPFDLEQVTVKEFSTHTEGSEIQLTVLFKYAHHVTIDRTLLNSQIDVSFITSLTSLTQLVLSLNQDASNLVPIVSSFKVTLYDINNNIIIGPQTVQVIIPARAVLDVNVDINDGNFPQIYDVTYYQP